MLIVFGKTLTNAPNLIGDQLSFPFPGFCSVSFHQKSAQISAITKRLARKTRNPVELF
jgi:hypothetical protein